MEVHAKLVDVVRNGFDFFTSIDRTQLGALGNIDHFGLRVVLKAPVDEARSDELRRQLAVGRLNLAQCSAGQELRSTALVHCNVRGLGAKDGVERLHARAQGNHIGARAIEHEIGFRWFAKVLFYQHFGFLCIDVVTIGVLVILIGRFYGLQNVGMNARMIVASETVHIIWWNWWMR